MVSKDDVLAAIKATERGPTEAELKGAPLLDYWRVELWGDHARLHGACDDHPEIDEPYVTTSPLLGLSWEGGWARSRSRWYELGPNLDPAHGQDEAGEYLAQLESALATFRAQVKAGLELSN